MRDLSAPKVSVCFPSYTVERGADATAKWRAQGYHVSVLVDSGREAPDADLVVHAKTYPGYWASVNYLARTAVLTHAVDLVVLIGDDMDPDPSKRASEIGAEYFARFPDGFGVMQPIGDKPFSPNCDLICGSPWLGFGWVLRAYRGAGPTWSEYNQFFGDEELQHLAKKLGVLWQRADLTQHHRHWMIEGGPAKTDYQKANDRHWKHDEDIYRKRRQPAGFPDSEPLDVLV